MNKEIEVRTALSILIAVLVVASGFLIYGFGKQQGMNSLRPSQTASSSLPMDETTTGVGASISGAPPGVIPAPTSTTPTEWEWLVPSSCINLSCPSWQDRNAPNDELPGWIYLTRIQVNETSVYSINLFFTVNTYQNEPQFCTNYFSASFRLLTDESGDLVPPDQTSIQCLPLATTTENLEVSFTISTTTAQTVGKSFAFQAFDGNAKLYYGFTATLQDNGAINMQDLVSQQQHGG